MAVSLVLEHSGRRADRLEASSVETRHLNSIIIGLRNPSFLEVEMIARHAGLPVWCPCLPHDRASMITVDDQLNHVGLEAVGFSRVAVACRGVSIAGVGPRSGRPISAPAS